MPVPGKKNPSEALALRITVVDPPPNILWALQSGRDELVRPTSTSKTRITFDFTVEVVAGDKPAVFASGSCRAGKASGRFVYLCIGAYAGQVGAPAGWRAKISLEGIGSELLKAVKAKRSGVLEARFAGTARDGGPSRASVPLSGEGWRIA